MKTSFLDRLRAPFVLMAAKQNYFESGMRMAGATGNGDLRRDLEALHSEALAAANSGRDTLSDAMQWLGVGRAPAALLDHGLLQRGKDRRGRDTLKFTAEGRAAALRGARVQRLNKKAGIQRAL